MKGNGNGKTAPKTAVGRPFANGSDPRRGGGKPGRSGRKPNEFIGRCRALSDTEVLNAIEAYFAKAKKYRANPLNGPADPAWRWCAEYVTNYGIGKPTQPIGNPESGEIVVRVIREEISVGHN